MTTEEIQNLLGGTADEVREMLKTDASINKGARPFELSPEQKAISKKATQAKRTTTATPMQKRKTELNDKKAQIIETFMREIAAMGAKNLETANPEREFTFAMGDNKFKVVLSMPRS